MEPLNPFASPSETVYTVSRLAREIRSILESSFGVVTVRGEVTNLGRPHSGHVYFALVDDGAGAGSRFASAQIPVVMWRSSASRLRFRLEGGQKVVITGRITAYEPRGTYQVIADRIVPEGVGELQLAFEQLKEKLQREGLFDAERKRPLPFFPRRIGLITSPSGAAIRDFLTTLYRRFPGAWVRLAPVRVQGEGAAEEIARALASFQTPAPQADVVVLARGGGSLEDLWAFNEESVARAVARSSVPVLSAVGHEVDFTIADFVADARAATPTAAAERVAPALADLHEELESGRRRLVLGLRSLLERRRERLERAAASRFLRDPQLYLQERFERLDRRASELQNSLYKQWRRWNDVLFTSAARLEGLSPFSVLARGYSVTMTSDGRVVRRASELEIGSRLLIRLAEGRVRAVVSEAPSDEVDRERSSPGGDPPPEAAGAPGRPRRE